jgi:pimeloyl-ACP methyl ester carboxylesterase
MRAAGPEIRIGARCEALDVRIFRSLLALTVLLAVTSCSSENDGARAGASPTTTTTAAVPAPTFASTACPAELPPAPAATCGFLTVAENRVHPTGRTIELFVTRLASRTSPVAAGPVLVLLGGPGDTPGLAGYVDNRLRDGRDVYILDQRGTGRSRPALTCPEISREDYRALGEDPDDPATIAARVDAARRCHDRLVARHVDLAAYNTAENATDVADLRRALHIRTWDLYGHSYGSRLALTVLRDHPEGIRAVMLTGTYPPNENRMTDLARTGADSLDKLLARTPGLKATFVALVERLERHPVRETATTADGRQVPILFDGDNLVSLLYQGLYETQLLPALPPLIEQLAQGKSFDVVAQLVGERAPALLDPENESLGMHYSVICQEDVATMDVEALRRDTRRYPSLDSVTVLHDGTREICKRWEVGRQPARAFAPVHSDVPVLMLTGELDPATSPAYVARAVRSLDHAYGFVLPGFGHYMNPYECPRIVRNSFFDHPDRRPTDACLAHPLE